jgi:hypothetical protein
VAPVSLWIFREHARRLLLSPRLHGSTHARRTPYRIAQQQKEIEALTATVKEQTAQILKVSAELAEASPSRGGLEASEFATGRIRRGGPAPQVVNNP